jgi:citrate lyase subunit beta/citryl-CoA lyase
VTPVAPLRYRSLLFVRADDEAALARALDSEADAVVADLEDSTPPHAKARARDVLANLWHEPAHGPTRNPARLVRVNELHSGLAADDLALAAELALDALVVPQASISTIDIAAGVGLPVLAVIESARGLHEAYDLALRPHVDALALGANDFARDLGLQPREDAQELLYARSKVVADGIAAGISGLFDRVWGDADAAGAAADAAFGRSLGFRGKSTLRAEHAAAINAAFSPSG